MKLCSWNVNGIRAAYKKGLDSFIRDTQPDILCLQETKAHPEQLSEEQRCPPTLSSSYFASADKKGYSGVASFFTEKTQPLTVRSGIEVAHFDSEGRFLISEHSDFTLYNIYFPSGTTGEIRQEFKYEFLAAVSAHFTQQSPEERARSIICGDFNICHRDIDIHHPEKATKLELSGFLPAERQWMDEFLQLGFVDSFRAAQGDVKDTYSWWSYRAGARKKNLGWRIDYVMLGAAFRNRIVSADILTDVLGSDHAPIILELDI